MAWDASAAISSGTRIVQFHTHGDAARYITLHPNARFGSVDRCHENWHSVLLGMACYRRVLAEPGEDIVFND